MPRKSGKAARKGNSSRDAGSKLSDLLSASVRARSLTRRFPAGDSIVSEGEEGSSAFILLNGACDVSVHGEVVSHVNAGEVFGEIACLERGTRTATVRAAADSEVLEISGQDLRAELRRSPALLDRFLRTMARRARDISRRETSARDEHRGLRRILENLHPSLDRFTSHPVLSVEVRWQPFTFASGDYYDVLELSPSRFLFALGDVMGHGAFTSPTLGMIRSQLHESVNSESRPHELLAHLHQHMLRHGHPDVFMTLTLLILDVDSLTAEFSVAGPPCPLIYAAGQCRPLTHQFGWTLGFPFDDIQFHSEQVQVTHGDSFLFYTDGLSDAARGPDSDRDVLGAKPLAEIFGDLCTRGSTGIADGVFTGVEQFQSGWPLGDDATALVVRVR